MSDPSLRVAFALAEALDTTVGELFGTSNLAAPVAAAPADRPGPPWSRSAVIRRCRCWPPRSGCWTRRSGSPGGRARARRRSGWPPAGSCTSPGRTCAGRTATTTSARPPNCCPGAAR
ncbi:MAG: hypothetical protein ACRDPF_35635 [Streptosporangiaceae bacterium]